MTLREHILTLWYFVRTKQFFVFSPVKEYRFLGPHYDWYDGPHYAFGFWFFTVVADGYKDHDKGTSRYSLMLIVEKFIREHKRGN